MLLLALLAPIGIAVMGLLLGIKEMFFAGIGLTALVFFAALLRSKS